MPFKNAYIPYGAYWSTPFCRWQGSYAHLHPVKFAAEVAKEALAARSLDPAVFEALYLGTTIPSKHVFYGGPWLAAMLGNDRITGPMIGQACATGAQVVSLAAHAVECGTYDAALTITTDKCSNGPHTTFADPYGPGGKPISEDWVWDNFGFDPYAKNSMLQTAENVAQEAGVTREESDKVVLRRDQQYQEAMANDSAFLRRYMTLPLEVKDPKGRKVVATVKGDEGVFATTEEGLAKLRPVMPEGIITFGAQTYPADGNCGLVVTNKKKAAELSRDPSIEVRVLSYGDGRVKKGFMAQATVPASKAALANAGLSIGDIDAIKTHNPFSVNDIYMARELDLDIDSMNNYGCSLIWGHPQGPTGHRLIMELIEELAIKGGGRGLFTGCAAGDSGATLILQVEKV